ncbi:MAG: PadR family transcriptional regulator [Defluviitaleaceae bacterium]|nr:PadR family transcriptional regulator [Defluviitaleaceae bacterium]
MILRVLCDDDSYGYEISKKITEISQGAYNMKETTLYSAFSRLEKSGALSSYPGTVTGGRERTYYTLTPAGYELYAQKCAEWRRTAPLIESFILEDEKNGGN